MLKEGATWRSLDLPGVAWQTVFGYHRKWAKTGFWARLWAALELPPDDGVRQVDSSCAKVHKDGANPAGGQASQAMGRTKGGLNSKFNKSRQVPVHPTTVDALRRYRDTRRTFYPDGSHDGSQPFFISDTGRRIEYGQCQQNFARRDETA